MPENDNALEPEGQTMPENEEAAPAAEAQQDVAQTSDTKSEATSTAKASDELSEDDLEAVSGGRYRGNLGNTQSLKL